jgi:hypothetical protein
MKTATELIRSYAEQAMLDTEDVLDLLLEFCADSEIDDVAVAALTERIEEEGVVDELRAFLVERGLFTTVAKPADGDQVLDFEDDGELDLDEEDLE